jgi:hypothetical protein
MDGLVLGHSFPNRKSCRQAAADTQHDCDL